MPTRGGNPRITIQADAQPVDKAVDQAEKSLDRLSQAGVRAGASLRTHIGGASVGIGSSLKSGLGGVAAIAGIGALGATIGSTLVTGIQGSLDAKDLNAKLTAQLGLTAKESARLGRIAGKLYASNYGDSMEEVNGAIKSVISDIDGMRKASSSRLKGITGDVISVAHAFDQDLGGVTRSVGQLMRTGLAKDAQDALNIVTVGFQAGDDKAGDFLDTLNEYGTQFRKLGIDGKTATGLISQGLKAGARDSDLVADSLKEFSIRAVDGSKTTSAGFKAIGLDAAKMSEQIGKGGPAARKGLDVVLDRLRAIKDPVKQSQAAVELFGTQAEDLGKALYALDPSKAVDGLGKVGGAARKVNTELGSTPKQQLVAFKREMEGLAVSAVQKATPALGKAATAVSSFIHGMKDGTGAGGRFAAAVTDQVQKVKTAISNWVTRNRADIDSVIKAFKTVATFAKQVFQDTVLPIIKRSMAAIGPIFDGLWHTIRGIVRLISGLLSGDWSKAWSGAKEAVGGAFKAIKTEVKTQAENLWQIIKDLGPKLIKGILTGLKNMGSALATGILEGIKAAAKAIPGLAASVLKGIGHAITSGISKGFGALNPFGDGEGITGTGGFTALSGGNALMGARSILAPFAGAAGRFGLHTTSGARPGAVTVSGNRSWHADGYAIDESGSPAGMLAYFRYLKATAGSRLRELIYTPGGVGIKDGRPYQYTGAVAAQHMDHVHVAYTGGIGDGIGDIKRRWVKDGGDPSAQDIAGAIAMAESGGNPSITHRNSDGSIDRGLFQINSTHGALSTINPDGNTRAAISISSNGRNWRPWTTYLSGAYKRFLTSSDLTSSAKSGSSAKSTFSAASGTANVTGNPYVASGTGSLAGGTGQNANGRSGGTGPAASRRTYGGAIDAIGFELAESEGDKQKTAKLLFEEAVLKRRRLDAIKRALKGHLRPETRSRLLGEATQLIGDLNDISAAMYDLTDGKAGRNADGIIGGTPAAAAERAAATASDNGAASGSSDAGGDPNQALIDATNALAEIERQKLDLDTQIVDNQTKILALANQGPGILAAVIAAVNGGIGGQLGLGFQTPGYAGRVATYGGGAGRL